MVHLWHILLSHGLKKKTSYQNKNTNNPHPHAPHPIKNKNKHINNPPPNPRTYAPTKKKLLGLLIRKEKRKKKKEKRNEMETIWILYIVFIIVGVALIVLLSIFFRPSKTTNYVNANTLQSAYDNGDGTLNVEGVTKPFAVGITQDGIHYNAATFSDTGATIDSFLNRVVGNTFTLHAQSKITNLQIIADFLHIDAGDPSRVVAIYDMETSEQLVSATVGIDDPVIDGFYTHALPADAQVTLKFERLYAIVAEVRSNDFYSRDQSFVQTPPAVQLRRRAEVTSSSILLPPLDAFVNDDPHNLQFASFQYVNLIVDQTTFQVDPRSQNASFPLNYVYNLNVHVGQNVVQLEPGICVSDAQNNNMLNNTIGNLVLSPEVVGVPNGLDVGVAKADQWYAVFLITSTVQGLPPAGLLSENRQLPSFLPLGYESTKRVGWARTTTNDATQFYPTIQQGNGTRRQTVYQQPFPQQTILSFSVLDIDDQRYITVPLTLVSPTCSSLVLQLSVFNLNFSPLNVFLREFESKTDVAQAVANPFDDSILSVEFPVSNFYSPHRMQIALGGTTSISNGATVVIQVQSFFDDL